MPRIIVTEGAVQGLERCRPFLRQKSPEAVRRAALAIQARFDLLAKQPEAGRPSGDKHDLRELLSEFGESGYVTLYRYSRDDDAVYILAFRHQKEAGY